MVGKGALVPTSSPPKVFHRRLRLSKHLIMLVMVVVSGGKVVSRGLTQITRRILRSLIYSRLCHLELARSIPGASVTYLFQILTHTYLPLHTHLTYNPARRSSSCITYHGDISYIYRFHYIGCIYRVNRFKCQIITGRKAKLKEKEKRERAQKYVL